MIFPRGWVLYLLCFLSMSCISYHVIMCITFSYVFVSCIRAFPHCPFCIPALLRPPVSHFASFHVRVLNVLGLDRDLPSGLGILLVDRLSSSVLFGLRLILQRLTEEPQRTRVCCSPTSLQSGPKPTKTPSIFSLVRS